MPDEPHLEIEYPAAWRYRVIGEDADALRAAIIDVIGSRECEVVEGNLSRTGKYTSVELRMTVDDEAHRYAVFNGLAEHPAVKMVL